MQNDRFCESNLVCLIKSGEYSNSWPLKYQEHCYSGMMVSKGNYPILPDFRSVNYYNLPR